MTVVFHPDRPSESLSKVICGTVMILAAAIVIHRTYHQSKNTFAYILMGLTIMIGVSQIGWAITDSFREEVTIPGGVVDYNQSQYSNSFLCYLYYLLTALQGWYFAMRYLKSAVECSLQKTCLNPECIKYTGWGVGIAYAASISIVTIW